MRCCLLPFFCPLYILCLYVCCCCWWCITAFHVLCNQTDTHADHWNHEKRVQLASVEWNNSEWEHVLTSTHTHIECMGICQQQLSSERERSERQEEERKKATVLKDKFNRVKGTKPSNKHSNDVYLDTN